MLIRVGISGFTSVLSRLTFVSACCVCVMCRFFVLPRIVMLGSLSVMFRGMRAVFRCLPVVIISALRHSVSFRPVNFPVGFGVETLPKNELSAGLEWGQNVAQSLTR